MVDIHCHILPEVDDGAKSWEIALEMCRMAAADGIDHIVATPHANHEYEYNRDQHEQTLDRLRSITGGIVAFSLGCDFHFSYENIQDALLHPERYRIGNTQYLLVEFSDFAISPMTGEFLQQLMAAGLTPIITHPERNPLLQRNPQRVLEWASQGTLVQITGNSLTGRWGPVAKKTTQFLVKHGAVHVLASDAHDLRNRPPALAAARDEMAKLAGKEAAQAMVEDNPRAIISAQPIPFQPAKKN
jgi:protein-tyrosine phosphatase